MTQAWQKRESERQGLIELINSEVWDQLDELEQGEELLFVLGLSILADFAQGPLEGLSFKLPIQRYIDTTHLAAVAAQKEYVRRRIESFASHTTEAAALRFRLGLAFLKSKESKTGSALTNAELDPRTEKVIYAGHARTDRVEL
jgi:hypothetical protein